MRTVVIDTNVLLSHPEAIGDFPDAEVLIPDTVLSEIDKLKTARVDAELRYKGREISRLLFELSERGNLSEGVDLPNGGRLRVVSLRGENSLPEGLVARNADDRILAIALQARTEGSEELTLVTNDLNMLLKAQSFGLSVERVETDDGFGRRYIIRPFQRYRVPLAILAIALAVFLAVVYLVAFSPFATSRANTGIASLPKEFVDQLSLDEQQLLTLLYRLDANTKDVDTQRSVAVLYDQMSGTNAALLPYAIKHYEALRTLDPGDVDTRNDLSTAYFRAGRLDDAIKEAIAVLREEPDHINENFNLGIFYENTTPKRYQDAANQFEKVIRLTQNSPTLINTLGRARTELDLVVKEAQAAGTPVKLSGGTL